MTKVSYMKEKMKTREHEIWGRWMTEHAMKKSGEFSPQGIKSIISYCNKFPETLIRRDVWMGNYGYKELHGQGICKYLYMYINIHGMSTAKDPLFHKCFHPRIPFAETGATTRKCQNSTLSWRKRTARKVLRLSGLVRKLRGTMLGSWKSTA